MTSTDDLEFFAAVVRAGTLTAAAREAGVTVGTISRTLAALEDRLGVRLATRGSRALTLTPEGELYARRGREIISEVRDLENALTPGEAALSGELRVLSTIGLGRLHVTPLLAEFQQKHPNVSCRLELSSLPLHAELADYDLAIHVGPVADSRLQMFPLLQSRRVVVAAPSYLERYGSPNDLRDLRHHNCLVLRENHGASTWVFGEAGHEARISVGGSLSSNDGLALMEWCLAGLGLAMRSTWHVQQPIRDGDLVQVLKTVATPPANVSALVPPVPRSSACVHALVSHLRRGLERRCSEPISNGMEPP